MYAGCYSLDLYCFGCSRVHGHPYDPNRDPRSQYTGETWNECKKQAQRYGWKFKFGECWCKDCKVPKSEAEFLVLKNKEEKNYDNSKV